MTANIFKRARQGFRLDVDQWADFNATAGPFPNPTVVFGFGDDGFPAILELSTPRSGPLVVISDEPQSRFELVKAIVLSLAWQNEPEEASAYVFFDDTKENVEFRQFSAHYKVPNITPASQSHTSEYSLFITVGDAVSSALPDAILSCYAHSVIPILFVSYAGAVALAPRLRRLAWTPLSGMFTASESDDTSLTSVALPKPTGKIGLYRYIERRSGRVVTWGIPPAVITYGWDTMLDGLDTTARMLEYEHGPRLPHR